jgi:hypothetical protein
MVKTILRNFLILVSSLIAIFLLLSLKQAIFSPVVAAVSPVAMINESKSKYIGEKIVYDVSLGWFSLGESTFQHLPDTIIEGKTVMEMTFETKIKGFYDLEEIYSDPVSALPLRVVRHINGWGYNEQIIEDYNQKDSVLKFTKFTGDKKTETQVKVNGTIHNAVLLPFFIRQIAELTPGWSIVVHVPQEFKINFVGIEEVSVPVGQFSAYLFKSEPDNFEIWISADEKRIPLKIKSQESTMAMKEYTLP